MVFFIVGYMGAGKSSVGREAARRAGMRFVDMDREVERIHGMTVAEIFDSEGEETFRRSERKVLERLAAETDDVIVSCGGGTPCQGDNMALMNGAGKTIYLKLGPAKLVGRFLPGQVKRPMLRGMDREQMLAFIERTLPVRETCYMQASMVIDCDTLGDDSICRHVAEYARHYAGKNLP